MRAYLVRLALKASWRGRKNDVLGAALVSLGAAAAVILALGVLSSAFMFHRVEQRSNARGFVDTPLGETPAMNWHYIFDAAPNGDQIFVHWFRFVDPEMRLPGVPGQPKPGSWFVSPQLAERMADEPALAMRYPDAQVIGPEGVAHATELVAYRFVGPDVPLVRGLSERTEPGRLIIGDPIDMDAFAVLRAGLLLLVVPVLALLLAAVAPVSVGLDERLGVLEAIGASRRVRSSLVLLQAGLSALPGAAAAGVFWYLLAPRLTSVPVVGREVLAGDLRLAIPFVLLGVALVVLTTGVLAAMRHGGSSGTRPTQRLRRKPPLIRAVPLLVGIVMMVRGSGAFGTPNGNEYIAGLIASAVGGVVALPVILHRCGDALAAAQGVLTTLVGRRLSWNARAAARAMLALGALATMAPVGAAFMQMSRDRLNDPINPAAVQPVDFPGALPAEEVAALAEKADAVALQLVQDPTLQPTDVSEPPRLLVGDCKALARFVELTRCDGQGFTLGPVGAGGFSRYQTFNAGQATPVEGRTTTPPGFAVIASVFVGADWRDVDAVLRAHMVNRDQPGPQLTYVVNPMHESPLTRWIVGGIAVAMLACGVALALHLVAQSSRLTGSRIRLSAIGADLRTIRWLASVESTLTIVMSGAVSLAVGLVATWFFIQLNPDARIPVDTLRSAAVFIGVVGLLGGVASTLSIRPESSAPRDQ